MLVSGQGLPVAIPLHVLGSTDLGAPYVRVPRTKHKSDDQPNRSGAKSPTTPPAEPVATTSSAPHVIGDRVDPGSAALAARNQQEGASTSSECFLRNRAHPSSPTSSPCTKAERARLAAGLAGGPRLPRRRDPAAGHASAKSKFRALERRSEE